MKCNKCGSSNLQIVSNTKGKVRGGRGCLMTCLWIMLAICTCGLILIIPALKNKTRGKVKTKFEAVCMDCGHHQKA